MNRIENEDDSKSVFPLPSDERAFGERSGPQTDCLCPGESAVLPPGLNLIHIRTPPI